MSWRALEDQRPVALVYRLTVGVINTSETTEHLKRLRIETADHSEGHEIGATKRERPLRTGRTPSPRSSTGGKGSPQPSPRKQQIISNGRAHRYTATRGPSRKMRAGGGPGSKTHLGPRAPFRLDLPRARNYCSCGPRGSYTWATYRVEIEEAVDLGDRVLLLTKSFGRLEGSTAEVEASVGNIWSIRDGTIVRFDAYLDRAEAVKAAGLEA